MTYNKQDPGQKLPLNSSRANLKDTGIFYCSNINFQTILKKKTKMMEYLEVLLSKLLLLTIVQLIILITILMLWLKTSINQIQVQLIPQNVKNYDK